MAFSLTPRERALDVEAASTSTDSTEAEIERSFVFITSPPSESASLSYITAASHPQEARTAHSTDVNQDSTDNGDTHTPADVEELVLAVAAMRIPDRDRRWYTITGEHGTQHTDSWSTAGRAAVCNSALVRSLTAQRLISSGRAAAYVVFIGRETGAVHTWPECQQLVSGVRYNIYQGYQSYAHASQAYAHALENGFVHKSSELPRDWRLNVRNPGPLFIGVTSRKVYVVFRGIRPGVYTTYLEAMVSVLGVNGNVFRSYDNEAVARADFIAATKRDGEVKALDG
ncbi:hypothetical protein CYLTODRAFT_480829 [Cylindrobasidium torrendii FP15055 ss-10]|uniref:Ribonuclease H1 N-terminal domain-containing protein n=1 Tax=Cylindrobasidium torrendii FP15055 ss-10 TaxID=1314674 RepID=A0A0D7AT74_9AGAR|nr:hypothetical protein CYLTODRAFT_480829 [Cylindrobasidium torrendii FP15055 ss-10]